MGGGGGGSTATWYHATSGQSGGRVMPGISVRERTDGYGHPQVGRTYSGSPGYVPLDPGIVVVDRRPNKAYTNLNSRGGAPGGGPGEQGANGGSFAVVKAASVGITDPNAYTYHYLRTTQSSGDDLFYTPYAAAGGGGWGAAGGSVINNAYDANYQIIGFTVDAPGGAGGKAIQTNGNSVTWLGGQDRAYGAVG